MSYFTVVKGFVEKNAPAILTGVAIAGVAATGVISFRQGAKYQEQKSMVENWDSMDWKWKAKRYWVPNMAAPVLTGGATVAAILCENRIQTRRAAAIFALYTASEIAGEEYRNKVVELYGKAKDRKVRESVMDDRIQATPRESVIFTHQGEMLCYDSLSGRYFKSNPETLRRIQNEVNHDLINDTWLSLNEVYDRIGLPGIKLGEEIGWTPDGLVEFSFTSRLTEDETPCLVLEFDVVPKSSYKVW